MSRSVEVVQHSKNSWFVYPSKLSALYDAALRGDVVALERESKQEGIVWEYVLFLAAQGGHLAMLEHISTKGELDWKYALLGANSEVMRWLTNKYISR